MSDLPERLRDDSVGLGLDGLALRDEAADEIDRLREALVKIRSKVGGNGIRDIVNEALKPLPDKTP